MDDRIFSAFLMFCAVFVAIAFLYDLRSVPRNFRRAIRPRMACLVFELSSYVAEAIEDNEDAELCPQAAVAACLIVLDHYQAEEPEQFLMLPESVRLPGWLTLPETAVSSADPLLACIMALQGLLLSPLDNCISRESKRLIEKTLNRQDVQAYRATHFGRVLANHG